MIHLAAVLAEPIQFKVSIAKEAPQFLETLSGYAWPVVTILGLLIFRKPITSFLKTISLRATKFEFAGASIELPVAREAGSALIAEIKEAKFFQFGESSVPLGDSSVGAISEAAFAADSFPTNSAGDAESALLNLGAGDEWITSRLYIAAFMLERTTSVKCVVFTRDLDSGERRFLGCASPKNIRVALAASQPWLETAFAQAYAMEFPHVPVPNVAQARIRIDGSLAAGPVLNIVRNFVQNLKDQSGAPNFNDPQNWVELSGPNDREHATWFSEVEMRRLIGIHLWKDAVEGRKGDDADERNKEIKSIAGKSAPYVALLKGGSFNSLVDRIALVAQLAQSIL